MPFTATGERVDLIINTLGVVNRTNSMQIFEVTLNAIGSAVGRYIDNDKLTHDEKVEVVFDVLYTLNEEKKSSDAMFSIYKNLDYDGRELFFKHITESGLYYHIPPMWESGEVLFYRIAKMLEKYDFLGPQDVYVKKFGRTIKVMRKLVVGDLYMMKLKQTSRKGFSARSSGSISKKGVPEKSNKAKNHQDMNPRTPIRMGEQEIINLLVGVDPKFIAQLHRYYRSSIIGRRELDGRLMSELGELDSLEDNSEAVNINAEILNAYLKILGFEIVFEDEDTDYIVAYDDSVHEWSYGDKDFIGTQDEFEDFIDDTRTREAIEQGDVKVFIDDEYEKEFNKVKEEMRHNREGTRITFEL